MDEAINGDGKACCEMTLMAHKLEHSDTCSNEE